MPAGGPAHGSAAPRGLSPIPGTGGGRFGRMFPSLPRRDAGADAIEVLADTMHRAPGARHANRRIPAGYTYLGQFIDHDITFDPGSRLERDNDPAALVNFRTPRFDLDSIYGSGPADQPYLYDWDDPDHPGVKLLIGGHPGDRTLAAVDLPRNQRGRALIGDARNDEHVILAQLHLLFLRFHNRVVDHCAEHDHLGGNELLEEAQRLVRWHYQWIVRHDYLHKLLGRPLSSFERRFFTWDDQPFIPIEFSGAVFRFGHSMVRKSYVLNGSRQNDHGKQVDVPIFLPLGSRNEDPNAHLGGFRPLPVALVLEWRRFFDVEPLPADVEMMFSQCIDPKLAAPLGSLPPDGAGLSRLNLQRGRALGLPSGTDVAHAMGLPGLSDAELMKALSYLGNDAAQAALARAMPLWYYVLCESFVDGIGGQSLGPVAGGILAEVVLGLLEGDPHSYLRQWPLWQPTLHDAASGVVPGTFTMADLVRFTER